MGTVIWEGDAIDIAQVSLVTLGGGPWVTGETITLTISDKQLILTIGTDVAATAVLDALVVMVSGTGTFGAGYSSNAPGDAVGEFAELTATEDGATILTLTAETAGLPFTLTSATDSALGTVADSTPTANSSKNDWNNIDNWDTGVVPIAADDVIFQNNSVSVLFGLNQSAIALASLTVRQNYTGEIGLTEIRAVTIPYNEYRGTFLQTAAAIITVGEGTGVGSGRIKIDSGATTPVALTVEATGSAVNVNQGAFIWKGTGDLGVDVVFRAGEIGLGMIDADVANVDQLDIVAASVLHFQGSARLININGAGTIDISADILTGIFLKGAGVATVRGAVPAGPVSGFVLEQGSLICTSPTDVLQVLKIFPGASADFSGALGVLTVTDEVELHPGGSLLDPLGNMVFTNDIKIIGGSLADVVLDLGKERVWGVA